MLRFFFIVDLLALVRVSFLAGAAVSPA